MEEILKQYIERLKDEVAPRWGMASEWDEAQREALKNVIKDLEKILKGEDKGFNY